MNTFCTKRLGMGILMMTLAGSALAVEPNAEDANVLGGPAVVDASGPDSGDTMSGSKNKARPTGDLPFRAYMGAIRGLAKAAQNNPELALTDEQKEELKAIGKAHKEKMKAFMEEHKEELAELRGKRGEHGQRGQKGQRGKKADQGDGEQSDQNARDGQQRRGAGDQAQGDRPSPELRQKMRERMAELMATAPSDQEAKKQLWAVLTPAQQDAVKENIKQIRSKRHAKAQKRINPSGQFDNEDKAKQKEKRQGQKGLRRAKKSNSNSDD